MSLDRKKIPETLKGNPHLPSIGLVVRAPRFCQNGFVVFARIAFGRVGLSGSLATLFARMVMALCSVCTIASDYVVYVQFCMVLAVSGPAFSATGLKL